MAGLPASADVMVTRTRATVNNSLPDGIHLSNRAFGGLLGLLAGYFLVSSGMVAVLAAGVAGYLAGGML